MYGKKDLFVPPWRNRMDFVRATYRHYRHSIDGEGKAAGSFDEKKIATSEV
jgi:hypothetical protein